MKAKEAGRKSRSIENASYFAPAHRAERRQLLRNIDFLSHNVLMNTLLRSAGGLLAVLNEHRQIIALNESLLQVLDVEDGKEVFGLRLGEAIHCVHARDMPGGCGTGRFCSSCGAAIAIVTSLCEKRPEERDCAVTVNRDGTTEDLFFRVRAYAVRIEEQRLVMLFLQDMTEHSRRAMLERVFLHDITNLVAGLVGNAELLNAEKDGRPSEHAREVLQLSLRLAKEIQVHRALLGADSTAITPVGEDISVKDVIGELRHVFSHHPVAGNKRLEVDAVSPESHIRTDLSLLIRVVANALTNAFEATAEGGTVRLWQEPANGGVTFCVWNEQMIPENVALRVFQRSFTTKTGAGRGVGAYVMKLLTETYLHGRVGFTTSAEAGTVFRIFVPDGAV